MTLGSTIDINELMLSFVASFLFSVTIAAVWTIYLSKSKRVRATYDIAARFGGRATPASLSQK